MNAEDFCFIRIFYESIFCVKRILVDNKLNVTCIIYSMFKFDKCK